MERPKIKKQAEKSACFLYDAVVTCAFTKLLQFIFEWRVVFDLNIWYAYYADKVSVWHTMIRRYRHVSFSWCLFWIYANAVLVRLPVMERSYQNCFRWRISRIDRNRLVRLFHPVSKVVIKKWREIIMKRFIALLLSFLLIFCVMPIVSATEEAPTSVMNVLQ